MNTIALHAESLAVTEYTPTYTGLSPNYEVVGGKLCKVEGSSDDGAAITPLVEFGLRPDEQGRMQRPRYVYLLGESGDSLAAYVQLPDGTRYDYTQPQRSGRSTRFVLGAGLRDNTLQLGLTGDAALTIEQLSFETITATKRRI